MFKNYFWLGTFLNIQRFVRKWDVCGHNKIWKNKKQSFLKLLPIPSRIWSKISIDFVVDLRENEKFKNFLIIFDKLNKRVILKFCNWINAETIVEIFIRRFYRQHGLPIIIISDRNKQFVNILWGKKCKIFGIPTKTFHGLPPTN